MRTDFDKYIDLLAIDASGSVITIELKRDKTPRDVVAQALDYASWVVEIDDSKLVDIYHDYSTKCAISEQSLDRAFESKFGVPFNDVNYDGSHQMVIVAAALDASSERIINYLNDKAKIPVNAVFFTVFEDGTNQYLSLDDDDAEYLIPVEWIKAVPLAQAFNETGLFGNQNSVCKPQTSKWSHTVERVKTHFNL